MAGTTAGIGDETKPICGGCTARHDTCEWGVRLSFRPENAHHVDHLPQIARYPPKAKFQIVDVTAEVIRDYFDDSTPTSNLTPQDPADGGANAHVAGIDSLRGTSISTPTTVPVEVALGVLHTQTTLDEPATSPLTFTTRMDGQMPFVSPHLSDSTFEDGIFLPGSQYQELHAQLRNAQFDTARSNAPSRLASPDLDPAAITPLDNAEADEESRRLAQLTSEQEGILWQNYIFEVAGWLDKHDIHRHFELVLPVLAKNHGHLKYSILALSARQIERKEQKPDYSCSLALYQHAIHLLSPLLHKRTTEVLASCIVLGVLEMLSCSPKAWRRHLDGCAALIQALGITGACGGLEQALFWCFARMDVCGGLISAEKTLIPMNSWMSGTSNILADLALFHCQASYDMHANQVQYLCGRVIELLCASGKWEQRSHRPTSSSPSSALDFFDYPTQWSHLFDVLETWYHQRPEGMKPLLHIPASDDDDENINKDRPTRPFPTIVFGNAPAISGNTMYHTTAILLLKHKPSSPSFSSAARSTSKPPSILWHAKQVCAIAISNVHHGCWTNNTQPLWIAGQQMSHKTEHRAILNMYERIERETGWATKWRADDLRDFWGE